MAILANALVSRLPKMGLLAAAVSSLCTLSLGGCAVSVPLSPFKTSGSEDVTGSIPKRATLLSARLDVEDWRRARAAMGTALDPQGNGSVVTWENAQTGAKGSFTPVAQIYPSEDKICRAFLAKIETEGGLEDVQGTACRDAASEWSIRDTKPWKRA